MCKCIPLLYYKNSSWKLGCKKLLIASFSGLCIWCKSMSKISSKTVFVAAWKTNKCSLYLIKRSPDFRFCMLLYINKIKIKFSDTDININYIVIRVPKSRFILVLWLQVEQLQQSHWAPCLTSPPCTIINQGFDPDSSQWGMFSTNH